MKKSKYSEQQIISLLKEVELGAKVADVCRKYGICYENAVSQVIFQYRNGKRFLRVNHRR